MFTDRFIKLPIKVFDREEVEVYGKEPIYEESWMKVLPLEICQYKPTVDYDGTECLYITLKNGEGLFVFLTSEQFEELLNKQFS